MSAGQDPIGRDDGRNAAASLLDAAFVAEERSGLILAFKLRIATLTAVLVFLTIFTPWPAVLYFYALHAGFATTGLITLLAAKGKLTLVWSRWIVPVGDLGLVTFALLYPNPLVPGGWEQLPIHLRSENVLYLLIFVAMATLSTSPIQVLWTGVVGAAAWVTGALVIGTQPGVRWIAMGNDPDAVVVHLVIQQAFLILLVSGVLAGAVTRQRAMVRRQVGLERERAQLARYFSPNMVEQLVDASRTFDAVREQPAAILFADIVGFTRIAESLPPTELISLLREFHDRMQQIVFKHDGTLDKYLGDGLMASFGTPQAGRRDATNAVAAAREMSTALAGWNRERANRAKIPIRAGFGVHWGPVLLGDIGGEQRIEFATLGDTVNVASRLEHMTRDLGAEIVISQALVDQLRVETAGSDADRLLAGFQRSHTLPVRGRAGTIEVYILPRVS